MCYKSLIFLTLCVATLIFIGCGGDEEIPIGEEVVVDKWIEPEDIGKNYTVGFPKVGDTVSLSTGGQYTMTKWSILDKRENGIFISTLVNVRENPENPGTFISDGEINRGYIVPEGDPIVSLYSKDLLLREGILNVGPHILINHPIRKHNNVQQWEGLTYMSYSVGIDREVHTLI